VCWERATEIIGDYTPKCFRPGTSQELQLYCEEVRAAFQVTPRDGLAAMLNVGLPHGSTKRPNLWRNPIARFEHD